MWSFPIVFTFQDLNLRILRPDFSTCTNFQLNPKKIHFEGWGWAVCLFVCLFLSLGIVIFSRIGFSTSIECQVYTLNLNFRGRGSSPKGRAICLSVGCCRQGYKWTRESCYITRILSGVIFRLLMSSVRLESFAIQKKMPPFAVLLSKITNKSLETFCNSYDLLKLIKERTCFKNLFNQSFIDLI